MLKELEIRNFAVVEEARFDLGPGLQILTGETGAGKSILVEAVGFLLGARATVDWLRAGAEKLEVSGTFEAGLEPPQGLPPGPWRLRRELDKNGKTRAQLNGRPVTLAQLAALGDLLLDFHGQHEHQTLLKPSQQLELLDRFAGLDPLRTKLSAGWSELQALEARKAAMQLSEEERLRRLDLLKFQVDEIDAVKPRLGEREELEAALPRLKNADRLRAAAEGLRSALDGEEGGAAGALSKAAKAAVEMSKLDPGASEIASIVEQARTAAAEAADRSAAHLESIDADPAALDDLIGRQDKLDRLERKYGPGMEAVLAHRDKAATELKALQNLDLELGTLERQLAKSRKALEDLSEDAHDKRAAAAKKLSAGVAKELQGLGMPGAKFSVSVEMEEGRLSATGSDLVEFLIAPNPGEPLKPLRSIASGGEMSRTMLALKTVLSSADRVPVLVFDEVDAGVGGVVAREVGKRLAAIARSRQVLVITHLPQIACYADSHFHVAKAVEKGRTRARVSVLAERDRVEEMARLLGGQQGTPASLRHAQELIEQAQKELA